MKKLVLISIMLTLTSGCASTNHHAAVTDYKFPSIETTSQQAKVYRDALQLKKKRFIEKQLLAKAAAFADPEQIVVESETTNTLVSQCKGIANSEWASSVLYGQDFLSYENHVETMKRCLSQEKRAGLSDVTTAMK